MKIHQQSGVCSNYGEIFASPEKKSYLIGSLLKINRQNEYFFLCVSVCMYFVLLLLCFVLFCSVNLV